jgi:hypothetical protein
LRSILAAPDLRQLRQRISINCHLLALSREEVEQYIRRRLEVAGNASAVLISPESLDAIFRYSRGVPRLINIICDFLLLSAFADETTLLTVDMVHDVVRDLDFENYYWVAPTTATGDTQEKLKDGGVSLAADTSPPDLQLHGMLAEISRRIESIEQTVVTPLQTAIKEQNERFAALQATVTSHTAATDSIILDLNAKLEQLRNNENRIEEVAPQENPKIGFVRRIFGGTTSSHRK